MKSPPVAVKLNNQSTGIGETNEPLFADPAKSKIIFQLPLVPFVSVPFPDPATPETPFKTPRATEERLLVLNEPLGAVWVNVGGTRVETQHRRLRWRRESYQRGKGDYGKS